MNFRNACSVSHLLFILQVRIKQPTAAAHIPALSIPTLMKARNTFSKLTWSPSSTAKFLLARFYKRNGGINSLRKPFCFFMYRSMPGTYITHWNLLSTPRLMYYYDLYYVFPHSFVDRPINIWIFSQDKYLSKLNSRTCSPCNLVMTTLIWYIIIKACIANMLH